MTRTETDQIVKEALRSIVCVYLSPLGFKRRGNSEYFTRSFGEFKQTLIFYWQRPRHADDHSDAHLTPYVRIAHSKLYEIQKSIAGERLAQGHPTSMFAGTIGLIGPAAGLADWRAKGEAGVFDSFNEIIEYIDCWVMPYLDRMSTLQDLIADFERGFCPFGVGEIWQLKIASAYYLLGRPQLAYETLKCAVNGKLAFERKYERPLQFLKEAMANVD